jgi:hypothetical protein
MQLSFGQPSTLRGYLTFAEIFLAGDSKAVKYLNEKIEQAPNGANEVVHVAEAAMMKLLNDVHQGADANSHPQRITQ